MTDVNISKVPMNQDYITTLDHTKLLPNNDKFRSLMGSLLYISCNTRPDVSIAVSLLSQKIEKPTERDWIEAKRILKYLKYTMDQKLHLGVSDYNNNLVCYADWGGNIQDRKSNCGFVLMLKGALIQWASRKQSSVSLSSTEAEYISLAEACQDILWMKRLIREFGFIQDDAVQVMEDNQSCIKLALGNRIGRRSKHIETKYHFIKQLNDDNVIKLNYCPTDKMIADCLTKPLGRNKLQYFRCRIGIY